MRRLRSSSSIRHLVAETKIDTRDLILPLFVTEGFNQSQPIESMPGVNRLSIDRVLEEVVEAESFGISAIALFPMIERSIKTPTAGESHNENGLIQTAIRQLKANTPNVLIIADVALDPYTSHGHDGILDQRSGYVLNDATNEILVKQALSLAHAGADIVAPSDMMDGRVGIIREKLEKEGLINTKIMAYAAKYASAYYGPFRDAIGSAPSLKKIDKNNYQMDYRNVKEALYECSLDLSEGADMLLIKPGMPYLDVLKSVVDEFAVPTFAFQVSGEYAMHCAAFDKNWLSREQIILESLTSFKRAGAAGILTYFAKDAAHLLSKSA
tara:strand:- start:1096 stop:2073 length:978 start_codon:yes stop_codon:yes gene_type:complete